MLFTNIKKMIMCCYLPIQGHSNRSNLFSSHRSLSLLSLWLAVSAMGWEGRTEEVNGSNTYKLIPWLDCSEWTKHFKLPVIPWLDCCEWVKHFKLIPWLDCREWTKHLKLIPWLDCSEWTKHFKLIPWLDCGNGPNTLN